MKHWHRLAALSGLVALTLGCMGGPEETEWSPVHTRWQRVLSPDGADPEIWILLPRGKLVRSQGRGTDSWARDKEQVRIEINEGYATYDGVLQGTHSIVGERRTERGTAPIRFDRLAAPAESLGFGDFDDLPDTFWEVYKGPSNTPDLHVLFRSGGQLEFSGDRNAIRDTWERSDNQLTLRLNDFATYTGTLIDGHTLVGTAKTDTKEWDFWAQRVVADAELDCDQGESGTFILDGSRWRATRDASPKLDEWVEFRAGGTLLYTDDRNPAADTWTQTGDSVRFEKNDGFVKYTGTLYGDHTIVAQARNVEGKAWLVHLTRVTSSAEHHCPPAAD